MPPKKKKGKGSKKKKQTSELTDDDKLKQMMVHTQSLKDQIAFKSDFSRRTKANYQEIKSKLDDANATLEEAESMHKSSNAYLTHQYKALQTDMGIKIHTLESELNATKKTLDSTEQTLKQTIHEKNNQIQDRDEKINELERKIEDLNIGYDRIIERNFDNFIGHLNKARLVWETDSIGIQTKNKTLLAELGLNSHDI